MLRLLTIENYGLIPRAEIAFAEGATMFTGETGSGKTMLLGALGLALGERAAADAVLRGAGRAIVTLAFDPDDAVRERFAADGFALDDGEEASIVREVSEAGKSSVRVNGRASTAAYVRELVGDVADIVGQHDAQRLLAAPYHGELLDRSAGDAARGIRERVAARHTELQAILKRLDALEGDDRRARQRCEDARYEANEIEATRIEPGEEERLSQRRRLLDNAERVAAALRTGGEALSADEGAASSLGTAAVALESIGDVGDDLRAMADRAIALQSETNELATEIARHLDGDEYDAGELDTINGRLDVLDKLKRKYGGSLEAVLAHAETARAIVADFENRDERLAQLQGQRDQTRALLATDAAALTATRKKAATALSKSVAAELRDLALAGASFDVRFETLAEIGADGAERTEFVFAANAGEPLRPLARVASGGELSRVLLAIVVALAGKRDRTALIFDEIDTGIGGATATAVGLRLGRLSREGQVACVTHLAQIASWADRHYVLEKHETKGATTISVRELAKPAEREAELARMLSGETHTIALEHARKLLAGVKR
jgi:DNA repair protein RecN (Recombination protein N)